MYRAVVNLVDNTITTVLTKWGGFSPQLAVVSSPCIQNNNQVKETFLMALLWLVNLATETDKIPVGELA